MGQARRSRARAGLTLLEVLGAIALLAILYTVLSGKAIEGLRSEGESRRRLEASLLADDRLMEIELGLGSGAAPAIGASEQEVDGFTVATEVRPLELSLPAPAAKEEGSLAARRAARQGEDAPSIFTPSRGTPDAQALRTIEVVVRWTEGIYEREVRRTTYALDTAAIEPLFQSLEAFQAGRKPKAKKDEDAKGSRADEQATQPLPNFEIPTPDASGEEP